MKSLASDIAALFAVFSGAKPRILIEIITTGGTKYYSDQYLYVGTQSYDARILSWGRLSMELGLGEDFIKQGKVPIKLSNHAPNISDDIASGDAVSIYIWDIGSPSGSKFKIFEGTVNNDIIAGYAEFSFTCTDVSAKYNKLIGEKLNAPNGDPNDAGKIRPIVYGSNKNVRCLSTVAGAITSLTGGFLFDYTGAIPVTDASRFPSSGTVWIGEEKISYTSKTATTLAGTITRGVGGTTATRHFRGDAVLEAVATVKYMAAGHVVDALSNAAIVPWGAPPEERVSVDDFAAYVEDDTGIATVELSQLPQIQKLVGLSVKTQPDQPVTSNGTHIHTGSISGNSQVNINADAVDSSQGVTNPGNAYDQNSDTYASLVHGTNAFLGLQFNYAAFDGLVIKKATAVIHHQAASAGWTTYRADLNSVSWTQALAASAVPGVEQRFEVSALLNETDWSNLDGLRVFAEDAGGVSVRVYELTWIIEYVPAVTVATHAADGISTSPLTTDAAIGGDSVAALLGGYLVCDVDGHPDVGGHWTDDDSSAATALIEKPVDVFHHILETYTNGPVAHANIDLTGSFADAEAEHTSMDKFAFVINQQIWVNELLFYLAQQFFCRFIWEAGIAKLNRIKITADSSGPDKSIDTDWDSIKRNGKLTVKEDRWGKDRVWNDITVNYDLDLIQSGGNWFANDAYLQQTQDEDAISISANGRQTRVVNAFAIGDNSTYADDLRDKFLLFYKDNRKYISFLSWTALIDMERGDELEITTDQLNLSAFDTEIVNIEIIFPKRGQSLIPIITALEI